jgi:hypothetical protein
MSTKYYNVDFFNKILGNGLQFDLSPDIYNIIKELDNNATEYIATLPQPTEPIKRNILKPDIRSCGGGSDRFPEKRRNMKQFQKDIPENEDWKNVRTVFKATKIEVKEGTEKQISEIRAALNKLSNKNVDTQKTVIIQLIHHTITESKEKDEDLNKIAQIIFDIASSNKFYSEIYAQLYKELISEFSVFNDKLENLIENYKESLNNICAVDPNVDYDGYCKYTKTNDLRKAMITFIVNLTKVNVINNELVLNLIMYLFENVSQKAQEANKTNEVEEITENIFILITQSSTLLNSSEVWDNQIVPKINELSKIRKTHPELYVSMSNRAGFKYMDMVDKL